MKKFLIFPLFVWLVSTPAVWAQGVDISWFGDRNPAISATGMAPGEKAEHPVSVRNDQPDPMDVYINIDRSSDPAFDDEFAKKLKFYVIDRNTGRFLAGGQGDRMNLKEAVEAGDIFLERLDSGEKNVYLIRVRFDKDAGNEFQNRGLKFDITMKVSGELTEKTTPAPPPLRPGQVLGGNQPPAGEVLGAKDENTFSPQSSAPEAEAAVKGKTVCQGALPWWVWWLSPFVFAVVFNLGLLGRRRLTEHLFRLAALIGMIGFWLVYDNCRDYWWTLIVSAVLALISLFVAYRFLAKEED